MSEHPASDKAKPGSKLAAQQALGRPGIGRMLARGAVEAVTKVASAMTPRRPPPAPPPADVDPLAKFVRRGQAAQIEADAILAKHKEVERVKALPRDERVKVAETAIADAMQKATLKEQKPWEKLGISRATYFNRKKAGTL
jgi:hypothetical protein